MKVSVIIPCYNHGQFLYETIKSAESSTHNDVEIIIVNDGSKDPYTLSVFKELESKNYRVVHKKNEGLSAARNYGIRLATGNLILPLDADDLISSQYISDAVKIFSKNPKVGIIYSKAKLFGDQNKVWALPDFSIQRFLKGNIIFCSAIFKKADWERVNGYKTEMKYGYEDWEFWFSLLELGLEVKRINQFHFFYRIRSESMARTVNLKNKKEAFDLIYKYHKEFILKHLDNPLLLAHQYREIHSLYNRIDSKFGQFMLSPFIKYFGKFFNRKPN